MAVAFDVEERDRITERLVAAAERLFAAQGLKKTSMEELTSPAGIAKSSFYAFFDSKEALYLEVMIRRAPLVGARLAAALDQPPGAGALAGLMRTIAGLLSGDPFYRRLFTHPDEMRAVRRRMGEQQVARVDPYVIAPLVDFIRAGQRDGRIVADTDAETVLGVLQTIGLLVLHREDYGDAYEQVLDATVRALAAGLTVFRGD